MASSLSSPSTASSDDPAKVDILADALYEAVKDAGGQARHWTQKDLDELDVIPGNSVIMLSKAIQKLCDGWLFRSMLDPQDGLCWKWRSEKDADVYRTIINRDYRIVYEAIEDAGTDGIWHRNLARKTNLHTSTLTAATKYLETKGLIKDMKSVESPTKKMYIKASLQPSEKATGGPWYTDGQLDVPFINDLTAFIFELVKARSAYNSKHAVYDGTRQPKKGVLKGGLTKGTKRDAKEISDDRPTHIAPRSKKSRLLPLPAGYTEYPTARSIAETLAQARVTNNTVLTEADVQMLMNNLVLDKVVEEIPIPNSLRKGYRVTNIARLDADPPQPRGPNEEDVKTPLGAQSLVNGYTEAPCGLCPVEKLCAVGSPVSPINCVYYNRWLGLEVEELPGANPPVEGTTTVLD